MRARVILIRAGVEQVFCQKHLSNVSSYQYNGLFLETI